MDCSLQRSTSTWAEMNNIWLPCESFSIFIEKSCVSAVPLFVIIRIPSVSLISASVGLSYQLTFLRLCVRTSFRGYFHFSYVLPFHYRMIHTCRFPRWFQVPFTCQSKMKWKIEDLKKLLKLFKAIDLHRFCTYWLLVVGRGHSIYSTNRFTRNIIQTFLIKILMQI